MYEGFFGLKKRPFSVVPNTESFVALESIQETLDDLLICVVQARGIGVLTSFAGFGKTLLCKQISDATTGRFQTVFLSTAAFSTRRALLQAILYEFGIHYEGLTEQEARLKIMEAARAIANEGQLLLLIVDEAHLLNTRLFEELRTLTDYAPEGEALIRLILSGQFELEEKLADPAMSAIHQRIGCQVTLNALSLEDSATLIQERLRLAGATDVSAIFSEPALEAICRASDGNPRCLCQLADHSCLLAFAEEQKPVQRETVLNALDDLKELPLHWNQLPATDSSSSETFPSEFSEAYHDLDTDEFEIPQAIREAPERSLVLHLPEDDEQLELIQEDSNPEDSTEIEYSVFEVGAEIAVTPDLPLDKMVPDNETAIEPPAVIENQKVSETSELEIGEYVEDKYAALDRAQEFPEELITRSAELDTLEISLGEATNSSALGEFDVAEILETIHSLREEIGAAVDDSKVRVEAHQPQADPEFLNMLDVVLPEPLEDGSVNEMPTEQMKTEESAQQFVQEESPVEQVAQEQPTGESSQRFAQLFTRLSQRRKRLKEQRRAG